MNRYKLIKINEPNTYLNKMEIDFKEKCNLTTKKLILENKNERFNLEIDEEMFNQYYLQVILIY